MQHPFIFHPGDWIGQGILSFTASPTKVRFYTKWVISEKKEQSIRAEQLIEQQGERDLLANSFIFEDFTDNNFKITLSNELLGTVYGTGVINPKQLAWEYRAAMNADREEPFEGFEIYELQENNDYLMHAEYYSGEQYRTIIDGRIWKKV